MGISFRSRTLQTPQNLVINHQYWTNARNNISPAPPEERIFHESNDIFEKMILRLKQKSAEWMIDLVSNFGKMWELVLNTHSSTLLAAKTVLRISNRRRIHKLLEKLEIFLRCLVIIGVQYKSQTLNRKADISERWKMIEASRVFIEKIRALLWLRRVGSSTVQPGVILVQILPMYLLIFSGNIHGSKTLLDKYSYISFSQPSER